MDDITNSDRAGFAQIGLQAFTNRVFHGAADRDLTDPDAFETALSDFLADLHHLADQHGLETWLRCLRRGSMHYHDEAQEEAQEERGVPANALD